MKKSIQNDLALHKNKSFDLHFVFLRYKGSEVIFLYYVYIHKDKRTKEVLYCGKGSNFRYCSYDSRSNEHVSLMKEHELDYIILDYFEDENDAYVYEEKITDQYKLINQCKFNISIGRRTSEATKVKLSRILKGKTRSEETKGRIKKNHARPFAKEVMMFKDGILIRSFSSSREAGNYASRNGICSYGWCGRSLKNGELTKSTYEFPNGGYLFSYQDAKMQLRKDQ